MSTVEKPIEQAVSALLNGAGDATGPERTEVRAALNDLATRLEETAEMLRQVVHLVKPQAPLTDVHLTPRELIILGHLADGRSNGEVAAACWISENTVKYHLRNIFSKLNVRDRGQAMMIARAMRRDR